MLEQHEHVPYISIWFGNFFEPAFSSKKFVKQGIEQLHHLGFNSIQLDSKAWQDFFERYEGKEASDYVAMQEYMMECIQKEDISHSFLAIYLNGDNLYPNIRFSPPVYGESVTDYYGNDGRWYKYWSEKAQQSMIDHLHGLYQLYGDNATCVEINGEKRFPVCSMWDPITAPSFDLDGQKRYQLWSEKRYGTIQAFNNCYNTKLTSFEQLTPQIYWFNGEVEEEPKREDYLKKTPLYYQFTDNLRYQSDELVSYFQTMQERVHQENPALYTAPVLSQWDMFLNIAPRPEFQRMSPLWDTCRRGIDPYEIAPYVDNCTFITVPCLPNGDSSAYVSSCENSMIRCMNFNREFTVGFYLGRYLYNDIYSVLTPCEIIATAVASGASGYYSYGYCGLDDGGVMHKLGRAFQESIQIGNRWAKRVIPQLHSPRKAQVAILYPAEMALTEPYTVAGNEERRLDLLGYYQAVCDCGLQADVLHPNQVAEGMLEHYKILILPADSCWETGQNEQMEIAVKSFVEQGGILFTSCEHLLPKQVFGIQSQFHPLECVRYQEGLILTGNTFHSFWDGEEIAHYEDSKKSAIVSHEIGIGTIYSFGFLYGAEYIKKETAAVPPQYGNHEYYPLCVAEHDPFMELLQACISTDYPIDKGIEIGTFANGVVVINHTSYPWSTEGFAGEKDFQQPCGTEMLMPHSAVFIKR